MVVKSLLLLDVVFVFSNLLSSLIYRSVRFFGTHSQQKTQPINRQINWDIKVRYMRRKFDHCRDTLLKSYRILVDLIIWKSSLLKLHTDLY